MSLSIGKKGEHTALLFLKKQGLKLIEKNFRCRFGEIDLIMKENETLVFIEVKFRKDSNYGWGKESVHFQKQKKLIKTAEIYLQNQKHSNTPCRFDVIDIIQNKIDWIQNAF